MMNSEKTGHRPGVGVIGGGRLGASLAFALLEAGFPLKSIVVRSRSRRQFLQTIFASSQLRNRITPSFLKETEILIIAVPDDAIEGMCQHLLHLFELWEGKYVCHLSGVHSSSHLQGLQEKGAHVFSFHPILSISSGDPRKVQFAGGYVDIEGDPQGIALAHQMATALQMHPIEVTPQQKIALHAAAVMYSNFLVGMAHHIRAYFKSQKLNTALYWKPFLPLIRSTIANLEKYPPEKALTGPLQRGDVQTIRKHLDNLQAGGSETLKNFYQFMSRMLLEMVGDDLPEEKKQLLEQLLGGKA